jgi:predicted nucleic acid-binding protein
MGLIIDTSALVAWERSQANNLKNASLGSELIYMPAIVWAEALIGVRLAATPVKAAQRRARLELIRSMVAIKPFTPEYAEHYADIYAELRSAGTPIPQNDMMVAATARAMSLSVLVSAKDEHHFRLVTGLGVEVFSHE